jgi:hypothetical protein
MRRLRTWLAPTDSGGRGEPSVPTTGRCLQWLDADRWKAGEIPLEWSWWPQAWPGSTVPRTEKPRWRAERRRAPDVRCRRRASERDLLPSCAFRRVIPLVFEGAKGKAHFARRRGTDGAWAQITPDIWLFDNCIGNDAARGTRLRCVNLRLTAL